MVEKMLETFVHPVRGKIFLEVVARKRATAKQLAEALPEIPQASLYRYLGKLVGDGLLEVAEEHKVRAVTEKVYAVKIDMDLGISKLLEENRGDVLMGLFVQFMLQLMGEFKAYTDREDINILQDICSFTTGPLYASNEELKELLAEIGEVLDRFRGKQYPPDPARKHRSLAVILTPPREAGQTEKEGL